MYHYNSTQYCRIEAVFFSLFNFPFLQTNITSQIWPSTGKEVTERQTNTKCRVWHPENSTHPPRVTGKGLQIGLIIIIII